MRSGFRQFYFQKSWISEHPSPPWAAPTEGKPETVPNYHIPLKEPNITSFRHASRSACDLSLNSGRLPRTVSSLLSSFSSVLDLLAALSLCCTWEEWIFQLFKVKVKITTWIASPECFDLMWLAIPEFEASLVLQPSLPRRTSLLQWRHRTSPSTFSKWVHHGLVNGLPAMVVIGRVYFLRTATAWIA